MSQLSTLIQPTHIARTLTHRIGSAAEFLFRTPTLLFALFAAATVLQGALLLTVNRAPAETMIPMTITAPRVDGCVMLCVEADSAPSDPAAAADPAPTPVLKAHSNSTAAATMSTSRCWMFCSAPTPAPAGIADDSSATWKLNL
ncbi:hypothetical protein ACQP0C_41855 (plasmid) [Nocardia sp. CA-129566]|uniref:hypothetical protein n=1 Tax=Nocardia sp. CA-129566 TaxID=3239976 RepID=UPI003D976778